jgi:hypothetical protein
MLRLSKLRSVTEVAENAIKEIKQDLSHGLTLRAATAKD